MTPPKKPPSVQSETKNKYNHRNTDNDILMDCLFLALITLNVLLSPYTKVEESFNLQATHDLLYYGPTRLDHFDHFEYPGVVPRTFVGSGILAAVAFPFMKLYEAIVQEPSHEFKMSVQKLVRILLGLSVAYGLRRFRVASREVFGPAASTAMMILQCSQFHGVFWASRPLPNVFAHGFVVLALAHWISSTAPLRPTDPHRATKRSGGKNKSSRAPDAIRTMPGGMAVADPEFSSRNIEHLFRTLKYITATGIIFRSELVALMASLCAVEWFVGRLGVWMVLRKTVPTAMVALVLSTAVDSYFWRTPFMWAEGQVFYFNTILNRSSEWGVSPMHSYFTTLLPKILGPAYFLAVYGILKDPRLRRFMLASVAFVAAMSCLGHKEWRFVMYVVPVFNLAAAVGWMSIEQACANSTSRAKRAVVWISRGLVALAFLYSILMSHISSLNYPGGYALRKIHELEDRSTPVHLHIDPYSAMTGASRFGQLHMESGTWTYSKNETHGSDASSYVDAAYTHLLTSEPKLHAKQFRTVAVISGFERIALGSPVVGIRRALECLEFDSSLSFKMSPSEPFSTMRRLRECIHRRRKSRSVQDSEEDGSRDEGKSESSSPTSQLQVIGALVEEIGPLKIVTEPKVWVMKRRR